MLDYARQRLIQLLDGTHSVVLITSGPAGVEASDVPCEAAADVLYVLLPGASDHLFNLEADSHVTLLAPDWELKGRAWTVKADEEVVLPALLGHEAADWCVLLRVEAGVLQVRHARGWGSIETLELSNDHSDK